MAVQMMQKVAKKLQVKLTRASRGRAIILSRSFASPVNNIHTYSAVPAPLTQVRISL